MKIRGLQPVIDKLPGVTKQRFIARLGPRAFDIALADPPYTVPHAERLVAAFRARPFAALLAVEHPASVAPGGDETRRYGDVALTFCHAP